jgi:hypothetical protein
MQSQTTSAQVQIAVEEGDEPEREREEEEQRRRDEVEEEGRRVEVEERRRALLYDKEWQHNDRAEWTDELGRAHVAFEVGRTWGLPWATCVHRFFDFEGAWGFVKGSYAMSRAARPQQVSGWLSRGRKWTMPPALGGLLGKRQATGQAAELWVAVWWGWWRSLQSKERELLDNGELSRPDKVNWSEMARMYGNNGFLQVMASLVWWGEVVQKRREEDREEWRTAVADVTWVLEHLLASGEIRR